MMPPDLLPLDSLHRYSTNPSLLLRIELALDLIEYRVMHSCIKWRVSIW